VRATIRNEFNTVNQLSFMKKDTLTGAGHRDGYQISVNEFGQMFSPVATSATLHAYVHGFEWPGVSATQTSNPKNAVTNVFAVARTGRIYVDRPTLMVAYTAHDIDGSFDIDKSTLGVKLSIGTLNQGCATTNVGVVSARHFDVCSLSVGESEFSSSTDRTLTSQVTVTPSSTDNDIVKGVGDIVLAKKPDWWDTSLRTTTVGLRTVSSFSTTKSSFMTLPTHPVYAYAGSNDAFDAIVFVNDDNYVTNSFTFELAYDNTKVEYVSYTISSDFMPPTVATSSINADSYKTFMTSAPSNAGTASPSRRQGTFFALSIRLKIIAGTPAGSYDNLVSLKVVDLVNDGNHAFVSSEYSTVLDSRDFLGGRSGGNMAVVDVSNVGVLPYAPTMGGQFLNTLPIKNSVESRGYGVTTLTDDVLTPRGYDSTTTVSSCSSTNAAYSVSNGLCRVSPTSSSMAANVLAEFELSSGSMTTDKVLMSVRTPQVVSLSVDDTTLNTIGGVDCSSSVGEYAYQRTRVRVYADGLDVTTLAAALHIDDTSVVDFVGTGMNILGGKKIGGTRIRLFDGAPASTEVGVSGQAVNVVSIRNRVITDVSWITRPSSSSTSASILLEQDLTQAPVEGAGVSADYGYLFSEVTWSDGHSEDVSGAQTSAQTSSSNIVFTPPGGTDNDGSEQWMVAVAPDATTQCITNQATASFERCGTILSTGIVPIYVNLALPSSIVFSISENVLTPTSDPATYAPFSKPTSSGFSLAVYYDDGTSIDNYASMDGVTYTTVAGCGTVDNDANRVTIDAGASCTSVTVQVSVVVGSQTYTATAQASVVRLISVATHLDAYPSGSLDVAELYKLPCSDTFERGRLRSVGHLDNGETGTVTQHMTFVSTNTGVASVESSVIVVPGAAGTVEVGASDLGGVVVTPVTFTVFDQQRASYVFSSTWDLTDGATIDGEKDDVHQTRFDLSYTAGSVTFGYPQLFSAYSWIDGSDIIDFSSSESAYLSIDQNGDITQEANYYSKITMTASVQCVPSSVWNRKVWSNLMPSEEDIDMGTVTRNQYSPYYYNTPASSDINIHIWARPKSGQYLRAVQISVELPSGLTSAGGSFVQNSASGFGIDTSFNVVDSSTMGLTASHSATVPHRNEIYLGYFVIPFVGSPSGLLDGAVTATVTSIQSDTLAADGAAGNVRTTKSNFASVTASGRVYIGEQARRRLQSLPPLSLPTHRRLITCDPCTARIPGDVDGDCQFNVNDVTSLQTFATQYSSFSSGSTTHDILVNYTGNGCGSTCTWCKDQMNPTLNYHGASFGGDDPNDPRYQRPHINLQDAIHLRRQTQFMHRALEPELNIVRMADDIGRPELQIIARVYGGVGQDQARVPAATQTTSTGTNVFFEVLMSGVSQANTLTVSTGSIVTTYSNPDLMHGEPASVAVSPSGYYRLAASQSTAVLIQGVYDATLEGYVAKLHTQDADVEYFVAIAIETKMNSQTTVSQTQAFLGLSTFPYSNSGYEFEPVFGSPYSAVSTSPKQSSFVNHCDPDPCAYYSTSGNDQHGASKCVNGIDGYTCICDDGHGHTSNTTELCDKLLDCREHHPCHAEGTYAVTGITHVQGQCGCQCNLHWEGDLCETYNDGGCSPNPCHHGGTCKDTPSGAVCTCKAGFTGTQCTDLNLVDDGQTFEFDTYGSNYKVNNEVWTNPALQACAGDITFARVNSAGHPLRLDVPDWPRDLEDDDWVTLNVPVGTYTYVCTSHPSMTNTLTVQYCDATLAFAAPDATAYVVTPDGGAYVNGSDIEVCAGNVHLKRTDGGHPLRFKDSDDQTLTTIQGNTGSFVDLTPGEYTYQCTSHPTMQGTMEVYDCSVGCHLYPTELHPVASRHDQKCNLLKDEYVLGACDTTAPDAQCEDWHRQFNCASCC
tara:strand:- start:874 stop:6555 length:5682 start_codon:yes stop_codon:yes gene_type:complete